MSSVVDSWDIWDITDNSLSEIRRPTTRENRVHQASEEVLIVSISEQAVLLNKEEAIRPEEEP